MLGDTVGDTVGDGEVDDGEVGDGVALVVAFAFGEPLGFAVGFGAVPLVLLVPDDGE